jgi:hypothetical protein
VPAVVALAPSRPPRAGSLFDRILGYRTLPKTQLQLPILSYSSGMIVGSSRRKGTSCSGASISRA